MTVARTRLRLPKHWHISELRLNLLTLGQGTKVKVARCVPKAATQPMKMPVQTNLLATRDLFSRLRKILTVKTTESGFRGGW